MRRRYGDSGACDRQRVCPSLQPDNVDSSHRDNDRANHSYRDNDRANDDHHDHGPDNDRGPDSHGVRDHRI